MKKYVSLIAVIAMLVSLCACGASQAADHENAAEPISAAEDIVETEAENTVDGSDVATDTNTANMSDLSDDQQIAVWLVQQFCSSDFFHEITENYESEIVTDARETEVTHGVIYELEDFNGVPVNVVMLRLSADWLYQGTVGEDICLLVDLETGDVYNSVTAEGVYGELLSCMYSHTEYGQTPMYSDMERCTEFTAEEIDAVNAALAGR